MVFSKYVVISTFKIPVHGNRSDQIDRFVYLGCQFTSADRCGQDIRRRITICIIGESSQEYECYVWSTLLHGAETWPLRAGMLKKLQAADMWFLRKILRISFRIHVTNENF